LEVVGQQLHPDHAGLLCRVVDPDDWCHACRCLGVPRDSVPRRLAHVPLGWRATILHVRIRRYRCSGCGQVWRQDTTAAAAPRAKLSTQAVMWALKSVVIDRMSIARIAAGLGASWHTVNDAVLATGHQLLIADPTRFDGVQVLGVDEHAWRHTRRGDKFVTVIIDLTPVRDGTGPSRLLDMAEGRSKQAFKTWLEAQTPAFRNRIEIVAMDGFLTATASGISSAAAVLKPVVPAGVLLDALAASVQRIAGQGDNTRRRPAGPVCPLAGGGPESPTRRSSA
jgi:transposase